MLQLSRTLFCGLALTQTYLTLASTNLLTAGDFETSKWGNWRISQDYGSYGSGIRGVKKLGYASERGGFINGSLDMYYPKINVQKGMLYDFSIYANFSNPEGCSFAINAENEAVIATGGIYPTRGLVANQWLKLGASFVAPDQRARLDFLYDCSFGLLASYAEFDDIQLVSAGPEIYTIDTPPVGPNMIKEPNFDSGTLNSFTFHAGGNVTYNVTTSGYNGAAHGLDVYLYTPASLATIFLIRQVVPAIIGKVYLFSIAYKFDSPLVRQCELFGELQEINSTPIIILVIFTAPTGKHTVVGDWVVASGLISPVGTNGSNFAITARCYAGASDVEMFVHLGAFEFFPLS